MSPCRWRWPGRLPPETAPSSASPSLPIEPPAGDPLVALAESGGNASKFTTNAPARPPVQAAPTLALEAAQEARGRVGSERRQEASASPCATVRTSAAGAAAVLLRSRPNYVGRASEIAAGSLLDASGQRLRTAGGRPSAGEEPVGYSCEVARPTSDDRRCLRTTRGSRSRRAVCARVRPAPRRPACFSPRGGRPSRLPSPVPPRTPRLRQSRGHRDLGAARRPRRKTARASADQRKAQGRSVVRRTRRSSHRPRTAVRGGSAEALERPQTPNRADQDPALRLLMPSAVPRSSSTLRPVHAVEYRLVRLGVRDRRPGGRADLEQAQLCKPAQAGPVDHSSPVPARPWPEKLVGFLTRRRQGPSRPTTRAQSGVALDSRLTRLRTRLRLSICDRR